MLKVDNVTYRYNGQEEPAANHLSFAVERGLICGLLGPNGSGKTTAIQLILGLLNAEEGSITVQNYSLISDSFHYKSSIGYCSDSESIYVNLTGFEYLNFIADMYGVSSSKREKIYRPLIADFQVDPFLDKPIKSCSHGTKKKFFIMASIVHSPPLWILDEPLTGLDVEAMMVLKRLMKSYAKQGNAVLFSSHIMEVCEQICDQIVIIKNGSIVHIAETLQVENKTLEQLLFRGGSIR